MAKDGFKTARFSQDTFDNIEAIKKLLEAHDKYSHAQLSNAGVIRIAIGYLKKSLERTGKDLNLDAKS